MSTDSKIHHLIPAQSHFKQRALHRDCCCCQEHRYGQNVSPLYWISHYKNTLEKGGKHSKTSDIIVCVRYKHKNTSFAIWEWWHGTKLLWVKFELKNIIFKHRKTHDATELAAISFPPCSPFCWPVSTTSLFTVVMQSYWMMQVTSTSAGKLKKKHITWNSDLNPSSCLCSYM